MKNQESKEWASSSGIQEENMKWDFNRHIKFLAEVGRRYPPEFLNDISDSAFDLVLNWMRKNNAPQEIIELMNDGYSLKVYLDIIHTGIELQDTSTCEIPEMVSRITKMIYESGKYLQAVEERMI